MTQTNVPNEIKCPHCGQTYAIGAEQWPNYAGKSITCTKCAQPFVVGATAAVAVVAMPPPMPPMGQPMYAPPTYVYPPPKKGLSTGAIIGIVIAALLVVAIPVVALLISILLPALNKVREEALKAKCSSNMKNIAAAMITYSNANNGEYPDSMVTLIHASGMTPAIYVCPDSTDTPITKPLLSVTQADLAGHCSYIYAAGGMNSNATSNQVLVYESNADHHGRGMNVLYGDYHVAWLTAAQAQQMIQSLPPGVAK